MSAIIQRQSKDLTISAMIIYSIGLILCGIYVAASLTGVGALAEALLPIVGASAIAIVLHLFMIIVVVASWDKYSRSTVHQIH